MRERSSAPHQLAARSQQQAVQLIAGRQRRERGDHTRSAVAPLDTRRGATPRARRQHGPICHVAVEEGQRTRCGQRSGPDRLGVVQPLGRLEQREDIPGKAVPRPHVAQLLVIQVLGPEPIGLLAREQRARAVAPQLGEALLARAGVHGARRQHRAGRAQEQLVGGVRRVCGDHAGQRIGRRGRRRESMRDEQDAARADEQRRAGTFLIGRRQSGLMETIDDRWAVQRGAVKAGIRDTAQPVQHAGGAEIQAPEDAIRRGPRLVIGRV